MDRKLILIFLGFLVLTTAVYAASFDNSFRRDDFWYLRHVIVNPPVSAVLNPMTGIHFYRPGAILLFLLEYKAFHLSGGFYIVFNFILHTGIALLALWIFRALGFGAATAVLAAGIFLLGAGHYAKQVMWACTSGPLLSTLLTMAAILLTLRWIGWGEPRPRGRSGIALPAAIITILCIAPSFHGLSIATPVLLACLVRIHGRKACVDHRRRLFTVLAPVALWLAVMVILIVFTERYRTMLFERFHAPLDMIHYIFKNPGFMIFPIQKSEIIGDNPLFLFLLRVSSPVQYILSTCTVIVIAGILIKGDAKLRAVTLWLYISLAPFAFVKLPESWLNLRYVYYPAIPLCVLIAHGVVHAAKNRGRAAAFAAISALAAFCVCTIILIGLLERHYEAKIGNDFNVKLMKEMKELVREHERR